MDHHRASCRSAPSSAEHVFQKCTAGATRRCKNWPAFLEPEPVDPDARSSSAHQHQLLTPWEPAPESGQVFEGLIRQISQRDTSPRAPDVAPPAPCSRRFHRAVTSGRLSTVLRTNLEHLSTLCCGTNGGVPASSGGARCESPRRRPWPACPPGLTICSRPCAHRMV